MGGLKVTEPLLHCSNYVWSSRTLLWLPVPLIPSQEDKAGKVITAWTGALPTLHAHILCLEALPQLHMHCMHRHSFPTPYTPYTQVLAPSPHLSTDTPGILPFNAYTHSTWVLPSHPHTLIYTVLHLVFYCLFNAIQLFIGFFLLLLHIELRFSENYLKWFKISFLSWNG